ALVEGAAGVMAGAANVVPAELSAVYDAIVGNDLVRARELWKRLYPTIDTMLSGDFIPAVKAGLELQGIPAGVPRRPMAPLSEQAYQALRADLATLRSVFTSWEPQGMAIAPPKGPRVGKPPRGLLAQHPARLTGILRIS